MGAWVGEARLGGRENRGLRPGLCPRPATGGARADSASQTQAACVHTPKHTRRLHASTTCTHKPCIHRLTQKQTHALTQAQVHGSAHNHTQAHTRTCPTCGQEDKPPARKHVQAQTHAVRRHRPTSPPSSSLLKAFPHLRVGPHCLFCKPQRTRPSDHDLLCFLRKELPAIWSLRAQRPGDPRCPLLGRAFRGTQETSRSHLLDIQSQLPQFGGRTATGHLDHGRRLRFRDAPPSVRRKGAAAGNRELIGLRGTDDSEKLCGPWARCGTVCTLICCCCTSLLRAIDH